MRKIESDVRDLWGNSISQSTTYRMETTRAISQSSQVSTITDSDVLAVAFALPSEHNVGVRGGF